MCCLGPSPKIQAAAQSMWLHGAGVREMAITVMQCLHHIHACMMQLSIYMYVYWAVNQIKCALVLDNTE